MKLVDLTHTFSIHTPVWVRIRRADATREYEKRMGKEVNDNWPRRTFSSCIRCRSAKVLLTWRTSAAMSNR